MKCIYKGDDAPNLITINYANPRGYQVNKLYTTCGAITHEFENPVFPFNDGYTAEETLQFDVNNTVYAGADIEGIGFKTFNGSVSFRACPKYVNKGETNE